MTTAGIAVTAALGGLLLLAVSAVLMRTWSRKADDEVVEALRQIGERMDVLATHLGRALERVHEDGGRTQSLLDLVHARGLDNVLSLTVEATAQIANVDAAIVRIEHGDGHHSIASRGIPDGLAADQRVSGPPDTRRLRAVHLSYRYRGDDEPPGAFRSCVTVPVEHEGELLGFLAAYSFDPRLDEDTVVGAVETVARTAAPAVDRAVSAPAPTAMNDALTGLGNRGAFHAALADALRDAHRRRTPLSLLVVDIDDFRSLNADLGPLGGDEILRWTAARIHDCVGEIAVSCRVGSDEFAIILPDASRAEAEGIFARIQATLLRQAFDATPSITLSGGIGEARPEDDGLSLFHRAEEALTRAKNAGRGTAA
jgi:diguanylate cyclase (GGDEF)-like protein